MEPTMVTTQRERIVSLKWADFSLERGGLVGEEGGGRHGDCFVAGLLRGKA
jgi:hypothetical protein